MRIALGVILLVHGVAHLPGFVVPWRLATLEQVAYRTTLLAGRVDVGDAGVRVVGLLWLAAALALAACGVGAMARAPWWTSATLIAASVSLLLSVAEWPQARIGVFINLPILALLVLNKQVGWLRCLQSGALDDTRLELPMLLRATLVWLLLVFLAVLNGAFRTGVVSPRFGERAGHVTSTVILSSLILITAWLTLPWLRPGAGRAAWTVGVLWLVLTVAFEFVAGHYLFGNPWSKLLADYNVLRGRVWLLVLLTTLVAPPLAFHVRGG